MVNIFRPQTRYDPNFVFFTTFFSDAHAQTASLFLLSASGGRAESQKLDLATSLSLQKAFNKWDTIKITDS